MHLNLAWQSSIIKGMSKPVYREWVVSAVKNSPAISSNHSQVIDMVTQAISLFKEYETSSYYSSSGRKVKRPQQSHTTFKGRYNQKEARTLLISGLTRAWSTGTGEKATISKKSHPDSSFVMFATEIFRLLGIGNVHKHLEEYTSIRKANFIENELIKDSDFTD